MKINTKSLIYGTAVMTLANLTIRILGFVYRVVLSRIIGPQGLGLIQLVYPVFFIAVAFTGSGLPLAVSRLVSEKKAKADHDGARYTISLSLILVAIISIFIIAIVLLNIDFIIQKIIGDNRVKGSLIVILPSLLFIGFAQVFKGYFYGTRDVNPPALAEVIEQVTRMGVAIGLLLWAAPKYSLPIVAALVMVGTVIGDLVSLLYVHSKYSIEQRKLLRSIGPYKRLTIDGSKGILASIGKIAIPVTCTRLVSSLLTAANSIIIPQRLMAAGMIQDDAVGLFGIMTGMVLPMLFMPFIVTNALQVNLVPNLAESVTLKRTKDLKDKIRKAIIITSYTAFPAVGLLVSLGAPIGDLLYAQPMVGRLLVPTAFGLVFHALSHTSTGIMNGLAQQNKAAIHYIIGSLVQLICSYALIAIPSIGIYGFIIGFYASSIMICLLNLKSALSKVRLNFKLLDWILKPALSALVMAAVCSVLYQLLASTGMPALIRLLFSFAPGAFSFLVSALALGGIPDWLVDSAKEKVSSFRGK